jgi:6-phosphofructokinase 1
MIKGDIVKLDSKAVSNTVQRGGTILKSARSEEFRTPEGRKKAFEQIQSLGIEGLVAIGGNGTFTGAEIFYNEFGIPSIGAPGTIDNDLYGTDFTIGFDTAINTAMDAIDKIRDTAESHNRVFVIEVMGRDAGLIALRSAIAGGAEALLVPEIKNDLPALFEKMKAWRSTKNSRIIVVAEGDESGGATKVSEKIKKEFPEFDVRVSILGHIQRGGNPTCMERVNAGMCGFQAVKAIIAGRKNEMVGIVNKTITFTPFEKAVKHRNTLDPDLEELIHILSA